MTRHLLHSSENGDESPLTRSGDGAPQTGASRRGMTLRARWKASGKHDPEHANASVRRSGRLADARACGRSRPGALGGTGVSSAAVAA